MWKVPLFKADYGEEEKNALVEVLESGWTTMGEKTVQFEDQFSRFLGENVSCLAVSSCTAALHMAMLALDIGPGDEVIVPALTFIADLNAVKMVGATPVVVDSTSLDDWNLSVADLKQKITKKTKAIIALHYAGYPFDPEIVNIAREHKIYLVEDVAHAIGGSRNGKMCGTWGDIAAFSFFANKNIAVGEGGMFVTSNPDLLQKAKYLRSHGMSAQSFDRREGRINSYDVLQAGLNYRLNEFASAMGIIQLEKLEVNNQKRKQRVAHYYKLLKSAGLLIPFQKKEEEIVPSYHIFPVLLPENIDRQNFIAEMKKAGIQVSIHYPAYNEFTFYKNIVKEETPVSNEISRRVVTLPLYPIMTLEQVEQVVEAIKLI